MGLFTLDLDSLIRATKFVPTNFTFITENDSYKCHLLLVAANSTTIASLLLDNPELSEYKLEMPDPSKQFSLIIDLFNGETIEISSENAMFLNAIATELKINSLLHACRPYLLDLGHNSDIEFDPLHPFKGIFAYFSPNEETGEIQIETSSCSIYGQPENLILQNGAPHYWESEDRQNSYCQFTFPHFRVKLSAYSLKSTDNDMDELHPKTWGVFGSNDLENWFSLHQTYKVDDLNGPSLDATYECVEKESDEPFKHIRIQQLGPNEKGTLVFRLARVELYGELVADD